MPLSGCCLALPLANTWASSSYRHLPVIALGHPLGATGAKLATQLIHELQRRGGGRGLVTMCVGGGMGAAGIFEVAA